MMKTTDPYKAHCLKCGYDWVKKSTSDPKVCPACNSRNWNNPKKNEYAECKNDGCYLFFDDKKAILLDTIENELTPQEIFINALYHGFDRRAKFIKIEDRDEAPRIMRTSVPTTLLFEFAETHKKETKFIFEVWDTVEQCIVSKNEIIGRETMKA